MKKLTFTLLLVSLLTLSACNSKKEKSISSNGSSSTTSSILKSSESTATSETQILSGSAQSVDQTTELPEHSTNSEMTQEQAQQRILDAFPDTNNEDVSLVFWQMIDNDFLFKAYSISLASQGGTGTVGFFRVSPDGNVYTTDANGTPF